jgi:hypothetical protein
LILDRKLYRGSRLGAGEIGQMTIDPSGVPGQYGNFGALEKYVGNNQIAARAQALYHAAGLAKTLEECSPLALENSAEAGDTIAHKVWEEVGFAIGITLCDIVWLLNPDKIVIGGGVGRAGEYVFGPIRKVIEERTMKIFHEGLAIVPAKLGDDAGMIGSAALALDQAARRALYVCGRWRLTLPNDNLPTQQLLAVEFEVAGEVRAAKEERKPIAVVRPHFVVGDAVERRPDRDRFLGFARLAGEMVR